MFCALRRAASLRWGASILKFTSSRSLVNTPYLFAHTTTCPAMRGAGGTGSSRAEKCPPVILAVLPEEWFNFFHVKTGVSGGYVLLFVLTNYALSKEIFVMEHEYYTGLSIFLILYYVTTRFGPAIGASLDKEVDAYVADLYKNRETETAHYESIIKESQASIWRTEGQKLLLDAKKENVYMQLEAAYRERLMHAYHMVKGRMDYHMKRYNAEARIHQKWMIAWILREVHKQITPEFEKRALDQAISDLEAVASKA